MVAPTIVGLACACSHCAEVSVDARDLGSPLFSHNYFNEPLVGFRANAPRGGSGSGHRIRRAADAARDLVGRLRGRHKAVAEALATELEIVADK